MLYGYVIIKLSHALTSNRTISRNRGRRPVHYFS
jgi:hypothetical protein